MSERTGTVDENHVQSGFNATFQLICQVVKDLAAYRFHSVFVRDEPASPLHDHAFTHVPTKGEQMMSLPSAGDGKVS